jgi:hypothetical protein
MSIMDEANNETNVSLLRKYNRWVENNEFVIPLWVGTIINAIIFAGLGALGCFLSIDQDRKILPALFYSIYFYIGLTVIAVLAQLVVLRSDGKQRKNYGEIEAKSKNFDSDNRALKEIVNEYHLMKNDIIDFTLGHLANDILHLSHTDRISVFVKKNDHFERIGRYSKNPELRTAGRAQYPLKEGCIYKAWIDGECFHDKIPRPQGKRPLQNWIKYHQKEFGISRATAEGLQMKSCWYYAKKMEDSSNINSVGVYVIESTDPNRFKENFIKTMLNNNMRELDRLRDIVNIVSQPHNI